MVETQSLAPEPTQHSYVNLCRGNDLIVASGLNMLTLFACFSAQPKSLDKATELFDRADTNGDGKLSLKELADVLKSASQEYSHLAEHVRFLDGCAPPCSIAQELTEIISYAPQLGIVH
jgi:hypothetical protein